MIPPELLDFLKQLPFVAVVLLIVFEMEKRQDRLAAEQSRVLRLLAHRIERLTLVFISHHMGPGERKNLDEILRVLDESEKAKDE